MYKGCQVFFNELKQKVPTSIMIDTIDRGSVSDEN